MNTPKVSIILPVYRVEKWIGETIESIKAQTLSDWEAIFVIDGSPDKSEEIVRNAMQSEPRIKILLQENQGQGAARDNGVSHAKGEYLFFLDPDDLMPPNALEVSYNRAVETDADIVIGDYIPFDDGKTPVKKYSKSLEKFSQHFSEMPEVFSRNDIKDDNFFYHSLYFMVVWMKLFKRKTWQENNIHAPSGLSMGEDMIAVKHMCFVVGRMAIVKAPLIYYRKRKGSSVTKRSDKAFGIFESYQAMNKMYEKLELSQNESTLMHEAYIHWFYMHMLKFTPIKSWPRFYQQMRETLLNFDAQSMKENGADNDSIRILKSIQSKGLGGVLFFTWAAIMRQLVLGSIISMLHLIHKITPRPIINPILSAINWIGKKVPKTKSAMDKVHSHLDIGR